MHATRRSLLAAVPVSVLAGCLGEDGDDGEADGGDGPTGGDENGGESDGDADEDGGSADDADDSADDGSGESDDGDGESDDDGAGGAVEVVSNAFEPDYLAVEPGATVEWTHVEGDHTVTLYHDENGTQDRAPDGVEAFDESLSDGTFEASFGTEGVYDYFCRPHEGMGMVGTVVVGEPDPDEPGLAAPADDLPEDARTALEDLAERTRAEFSLEEGDDGAESGGDGGDGDDGDGGGGIDY